MSTGTWTWQQCRPIACAGWYAAGLCRCTKKDVPDFGCSGMREQLCNSPLAPESFLRPLGPDTARPAAWQPGFWDEKWHLGPAPSDCPRRAFRGRITLSFERAVAPFPVTGADPLWWRGVTGSFAGAYCRPWAPETSFVRWMTCRHITSELQGG
jgi:hypothetical protein